MTDPTQPPQPPTGQPQYPPAPYGPPYPQYGPPPGFMAPPPPAKKSHTGLILGIVGGVVGLIIVCVVGGIFVLGAGAKGVKNQIDKDQQQANADVQIAGCTSESMLDEEVGKATVVIHNSSSSAKSYFVTVAFESSSGAVQYDTADAVANNLGAGQVTTVEAQGFSHVGSDLKCRVVDVTRL